MGLSQDVVVVSEYSLNTGHDSGTRGGTPGKYIMRYMTRDRAVENVAPTLVEDSDGMLDRYDRYGRIAEEMSSTDGMESAFEDTCKKGGLAFSDGNPSLSDAALRRDSREVQKKFNEGHTAIKTVISFTDDYLRENGILEQDFVHERRGDYAGHIDQMKLRFAVMNGMKKLASSFDDLHYTGVIQTNTDHVHCHLLIMDYGQGTAGPDGRQKGKLSSEQKTMIRRGIDLYLDEKQTVPMMASSVGHDRQNVKSYVKKFTHETLAREGFPQFLLACLPKDRKLWSANTNRQEMRKANAIVREFVNDILAPDGHPSGPYAEARQSIIDYADARTDREGLNEEERMRFIRNGDDRLVRECMNSVYSVLKRVPEEELNLRTGMLEMMSMDYESMAAMQRALPEDDSLEFGFKLRTYGSRLDTHRKNYHLFRDEAARYDAESDKSPDSEPFGEFLHMEAIYQQMLMVKYQSFLSFLPPDEDIDDDFAEVMAQDDRLERMEAMTDDSAFAGLDDEAADRYGMEVYGIGNGRFVRNMPDAWNRLLTRERDHTREMTGKFREKLQDYGMDFDGHGVRRKLMYDFDDVKALDLHHLRYDFPYDAAISRVNADAFIEAANRRYDLYMGAEDYLIRSGQNGVIEDLPGDDIREMKRFADTLLERETVSIPSGRPGVMRQHDGSTIHLMGDDYFSDMQAAVRNMVETARYYE